MIRPLMNNMLSRRFSRIRFEFTELDTEKTNCGTFGMYIHVPFCTQFCSYCPFYKVKYRKELKRGYLHALLKEFDLRHLEGQCSWLYLGGGTPNLLTPDEIATILSHVKERVSLRDVGMEGNPQLFTPSYLERVYSAGVEKISMGVETFSEGALEKVHRQKSDRRNVEEAVARAASLGMSVNVDLMVGLPGQDRELCLSDVRTLCEISPSQVTIYPFLTIRGVQSTPSMDEREMFEVIEESGAVLERHGYRRDSIWAFAHGDIKGTCDSARDELVSDYLGFGPAAFSTIGRVQVVNPALELYLDMTEKGKWYGFRTELGDSASDWRRFSHELYKLSMDPVALQRLPRGMRVLALLLRLTGDMDGVEVTEKGRYMVHSLTKKVVQSLPFPLQNPDVVTNWMHYERHLPDMERGSAL